MFKSARTLKTYSICFSELWCILDLSDRRLSKFFIPWSVRWLHIGRCYLKRVHIRIPDTNFGVLKS